jgi:DedD protein
MDSRAKQRLTGAVILVALFVLLVPELLTGPKNATDEPAQEEGLRRYTIDLNAPSVPAGQTQAAPEVQLPAVAAPGAGLAQPGEAAAPEPGDTPAPVATPAPGASSSTASVPAASNPAPATQAPVAVRPAPTASAAEPPRESARPPASASGGRFVVQLGSFGSRDNAERLVRDMTAKGFATFIAPITTNGRELYRVRVGPTKDRAAAEALAAQLKRMGQSGSIVPIP